MKFNSLLAHPIFGAHECAVLANDTARNFKQNGGAGTHWTRTQCADQCQLAPITTATRVANATHLGVRGWIARLHAQVVATRHHASLIIKQRTANGNTALFPTSLRFRDGRVKSNANNLWRNLARYLLSSWRAPTLLEGFNGLNERWLKTLEGFLLDQLVAQWLVGATEILKQVLLKVVHLINRNIVH